MTDQDLRRRLAEAVVHLADGIGPRNIHYYVALNRAADYIECALSELGYSPIRQTYEARGKTFHNIVAERPGTSSGVVVLGAHYDTHNDSPGLDDNGSAVAGLLELARVATRLLPHFTVRFIAFTNEESPFTRTEL
jgi:acetylornithine deacetylase/succinyl-diaminopimelate desuccinylase-like protein